MVQLRKELISLIILLTLAVFTVKAGEFSDNYRHGWTYENEIWQFSLFYSRPDDREVLIRFRLRDGVEKHQVVYSLSLGVNPAPELLIKDSEAFLPFEKINIELNSRRREKVVLLRFAEDLSIASAYYPITLRPDGDSGINPVINMEIFHPQLANIIVHKENIHFKINSGPGRYKEEPFLVEVLTNYTGWSLKAYLTPLILEEDGILERGKESPVIAMEKILISVNGSEAVPLRKGGFLVSSGSRDRMKKFLVQLFIDSNLADKAGDYTGAKLIFALE